MRNKKPLKIVYVYERSIWDNMTLKFKIVIPIKNTYKPDIDNLY